MNIVCFTGHRPNKLGGYDWNTDKNKAILLALYKQTKLCIKPNDMNMFIFGGALGVDQMAFEIVKKIQKEHKYDIQLVLAVPFKDQPIRWNERDRCIYDNQIETADCVVYVDTIDKYKCDKVEIGKYHRDKMMLRNMYMVDHSDTVIGVWNRTPGGTGNCIQYARSENKNLIIIDPDKLEGVY